MNLGFMTIVLYSGYLKTIINFIILLLSYKAFRTIL